MKNALILHGTSGNSHSHWFQWLKNELEKNGYTVWVPDLPGADNPNIKIYNDFIFSYKEFEFNSDTIIIGHSSGAVEILGLLQNLPENITINSVYLIGSFMDNLGRADLEGLFETPFDFDLIKTKSKKFIFFHSDDDPYCPLEHAKYLVEKTAGELVFMPGQKHFSTSTAGEKYIQFPELLEKIKQTV
jgi:uncharacterized protein